MRLFYGHHFHPPVLPPASNSKSKKFPPTVTHLCVNIDEEDKKVNNN